MDLNHSYVHVIGSFEPNITFRNNHTAFTLHVLEGSHIWFTTYRISVHALHISLTHAQTSRAKLCM